MSPATRASLLVLLSQACGAFVMPSHLNFAHKLVTRAKGDQEITDLNLEEMFDVFEAADKEIADEKGKVEVGSKEYLEGFVNSPIVDDGLLTRDPLGGLDQAVKLGAGATVVLGILFLGFMASNGLI